MIWILELMVYVGMLVLNFHLIRKGKATISQRYHRRFNQKWDYVIMIGFLILQIIYHAKFTPVIGLGEIIACIIRNTIVGHWCWHED